MRAYDLLESLCAELELEQQGMQSPPYRVTLPVADRRRVSVPEDAHFFTFIYPLTPWSMQRTRESQRGVGGTGGGDSASGGGSLGSSAGSRAEKIDRFLNEPVPMDEEDEEVGLEKRRRHTCLACCKLAFATPPHTC